MATDKQATQIEESGKKVELGDVLLQKLKDMSGTEAIQLAQKLVRQESSSTITERGQGNGFSQLHLEVDRSVGTIQRVKLPQLLALWAKDLASFAPAALVRAVEKTIEELLLVEPEEWSGHKFHISFANGKGDLVFLFLALDKVSGDTGEKVRFTKGKMAGQFALAPDYVVMRHSRNSFFKTKQWDEVVYIPRGITQSDVASLIATIQLPAMDHLEDRTYQQSIQQ